MLEWIWSKKKQGFSLLVGNSSLITSYYFLDVISLYRLEQDYMDMSGAKNGDMPEWIWFKKNNTIEVIHDKNDEVGLTSHINPLWVL